MTIPDDEMVMLPLLETLGGAASMKLGDAVDLFAGRFRLTPDECRQMLPSGSCPVFRSWVSRVSWAKTCLKQAGPIDRPKRGEKVLTPMGRDLLATKPSAVHLQS